MNAKAVGSLHLGCFDFSKNLQDVFKSNPYQHLHLHKNLQDVFKSNPYQHLHLHKNLQYKACHHLLMVSHLQYLCQIHWTNIMFYY